MPGGPSRTTFSLPARKSSWPRCRTVSRLRLGLEGEVELLERLARREPRGLDAGLAAVALAGVGLGLQQRGGEVLVGPLLRPGAVGELRQRPRGRRRLQRAEQVRELASWGRSCDQRVVAGERADLDRPVSAGFAAGAQRPGVLEVQ